MRLLDVELLHGSSSIHDNNEQLAFTRPAVAGAVLVVLTVIELIVWGADDWFRFVKLAIGAMFIAGGFVWRRRSRA
ncbi:hypothetical protein [Subtercola endophyticus]|uniref:hypothetical protein n=1 Tax=Subtercola endophyticus TaxID=2895559 RepID=UPI001E3B3D5F|nr:hypothetical protein [Subtercola endophyticus]UFS60665.1 hypothetical protein LQ955_07970 [Subtercola endophyticus]